MQEAHGHILIVDDNDINRRVLAGLMAGQGHTFGLASNGQEALEKLNAHAFDVVLLDVMMPKMDGYETLTRIKADPCLQHLPVIMISAVDEMESVIRCIAMGATDYLPKPFNAALLRARINTSLAGKRLRDLEREYLEQVAHVSAAAVAIEAGQFKSEMLDCVACRPDALGRLAKVFQHMAGEVYAREQRLKMQLEQLQSDIDEHLRAHGDCAAMHVPMDRRQALACGRTLPDRAFGAALFADISGFTALTESLAHEMGFQRGAEEITRHLNRVYDALVDKVHQYGGSVIVFGGDAITCWFDGDNGLRATACALAMQASMPPFAALGTPGGMAISIGIKVAVVSGTVRRFLVGDPAIQHLEALGGTMLDDLAATEQFARRGDVLMSAGVAAQLGAGVKTGPGRGGAPGQPVCVPVLALAAPLRPSPWPPLDAGRVTNEMARPWLLPLVYEKVRGGESEYLSELRPAAALLLKFSGIDYNNDPQAQAKLDAFVRWVQSVVKRHDGSLVQISLADKGSSLCATFGAPVAHPDDAVRAVKTAWLLRDPPQELAFIRDIRMGLAHGLVRAGAYGGTSQRAYGVIGDRINLAARLMVAAPPGGILCDEAICQLAKPAANFEMLPPMLVKGKAAPVAVGRLSGMNHAGEMLIDLLSPARQLVLKVASLLGDSFEEPLLCAIYPVETEKPNIRGHIDALVEAGLMARQPATDGGGPVCQFQDSAIRQASYNLMLFSQRRQLHRLAAECIERGASGGAQERFALLASHWKGAEDYPKAVACLEKAGEQARQKGQLAEAQAFLQESLALEHAVLGGSVRNP